jgi:DNA-binding transcriptional LysR family regulator
MEWSERIGRRIKLRDLHILLAVAHCRSIAKAAKHLAVSQPVVSKVIADLEHILGVRLLDRDRHGAEPTIYGDALLKRGIAAFDELRLGVKDIEFLTDPTAGELRIGATEPMAGGLIPAVIDRISRQCPRIAFHVRQAPSAAQLDRELGDRNIDLIIGRIPTPIMEDDLEVEILFNEPIFVVAGNQNPLARRRRRMKLSELADELWALPLPDTTAGFLIADIFKAGGLKVPQTGVVCNSIQMHNALLPTGRYLALLPGSFLWFSAKRLSLKVLPVEMPLRSTPVGIVRLKNRTLNPIAKLFIDCARTLARPLAKGQRQRRE